MDFTPDNALMSKSMTGKVPSATGTLILRDTMTGSAAMQLSEYQEMNNKPEVEFTYLSGGVGAYWVGEGERIKTSKPTWLNAKMTSKKLGVIVPVSSEFLKYTAADFFTQVRPLIAEAFYTKFDQAVLWGNDSPYGAANSVWGDIQASGNQLALGSTGKGLYTELSEIMGMVEDADGDPNGFITIKSNKRLLRNALDSQGKPLFNEATQGTPDSLLGQAVAYANKFSWDRTKAEILTGDWKYSRYGINGDIEYKILTEGVIDTILGSDGLPLNLATQDMVAIRATMHVGYMKLKEGNFAALTPAVVTP